jgi:hypothetical protein
MAEVSTTTQVYRDRLTPAFERRGWNTAMLTKYRKRKAGILAEALDAPQFSSQDREEYKRLLVELGDSPSLRLRFLLFRLGATPLVRRQRKLTVRVKDIVKNFRDRKRESQSICLS